MSGKPQWRIAAEQMACVKVPEPVCDGMKRSEAFTSHLERTSQYLDEFERLVRDYERNGVTSEVALFMQKREDRR